MRQQLPEDAGYPLSVAGVGLVQPGQKFDAPDPVPGCISLEPAQDTPPEDGQPAASNGDSGDTASDDSTTSGTPARRTGRRAATREDSA